MQAQGTWAIEYNVVDGTFHVGRTTEMLQRNIQSMATGEHHNYICVGIFKDREQAINAILEFRRNRIPGYSMTLPL
jgi:hypothetical protein